MKPLVGRYLAAGLIAALTSAVAAPGKVDATRRATSVSTEQKAVLPEKVPLQKNEVLTDQRFESQTVPKKDALVGERRSTIETKETREKTMIQPERKDYDKIDRKDSPWAGKISRYSTKDDTYTTERTNRFQDKIGEASPVTNKVKPVTSQRTVFDRINRFAFRKNSDTSVTLSTAGSEKAPTDASNRSSLGNPTVTATTEPPGTPKR
ncbi:MAG: hypothetical protein NTU80_12735 [Verrucomicrobia bacterium]|nr:hypothetical protein [Verrucomicrobiota bacterium]